MKNLIIAFLTMSFFFASCDDKNNKRRRVDFSQVKSELNLNAEQEQKYDEIIAKYDEQRTQNRPMQGDKIDRVLMFEKMEEISKNQEEELIPVLDENQLKIYRDFVEKNTRKRPGYSKELMAQLNSELELDEAQSKTLEAVNNAFEKQFHDAHDIYHGNPELAAEYWNKYDEERKNALQKAFTEEQYQKYLDLVKDVAPRVNK